MVDKAHVDGNFGISCQDGLRRYPLLVALPFFNDRLFSLSEDLILAEERTTERDRKKITEGETRAVEMVSFHALILWSCRVYIRHRHPPLLNHAASEHCEHSDPIGNG